MDERPLFVVLLHGAPSIFFQRIVLPFATRFALPPAGLDQATLLEAVQNRIKHSVGPFHFAAGTGLDFLDDGVPVAFAPVE